MGTLKKFFKYFLMFIAFFLLIGFLTNFEMRENYRNTENYEIKTQSPEIKVDEFKVARTNGYIKGSVTNNVGEFFQLKYLKISLYDKNGIHLGDEYKELKSFNVNETIKFDIGFKYSNVEKATLEITDVKTEVEKISFFRNIDWEDDKMKIALPIGVILGLYAILP